MQPRFVSVLIATTALAAVLGLAAAASAAETEHDRHVFVNNATDPTPEAAGSANGGVWRSVDSGRGAAGAPSSATTAPPQNAPAAQPGVQAQARSSADALTDGLLVIRNHASEAPQNAPAAQTGVQAQTGGAEPLTDGLMILRSMAAEPAAPQNAPTAEQGVQAGSADPQADGLLMMRYLGGAATEAPQNAPPAEQGVQAQTGSAALIVPAVQQVRIKPASPPPQATDGVLILRHLFGAAPDTPEQTASQPQMDGVVVLASEGQTAAPRDPEMPICGHCSSDVAQPAAPAAAAEQPRERRRGGFSISIGGVTVGSGGVSVAAGDINGDGHESGRQHAPVRPVRESSPRR